MCLSDIMLNGLIRARCTEAGGRYGFFLPDKKLSIKCTLGVHKLVHLSKGEFTEYLSTYDFPRRPF